MNVLVPPPAQVVKPGKTIKWAVGDLAGPRSQVWSVKGHKRTDDVYVGARNRMDEVKLSLHRDKWRLAYTAEAAPRLVKSGEDRVLLRWPVTPELTPGWRRGVTILVAASMLGPAVEGEDVADRNIAWFPAPLLGRGLRFDVLLGDPGAGVLTVNDCAGEVGRTVLATGKALWVVATEVDLAGDYEQALAELRRWGDEAAAGAEEELRGWALGHFNDDRGPVIIDISTVTP